MTDGEWTLIEDDLAAWSPVHSAQVRRDPDAGLVLNDGGGHDWHLIRIVDPKARFATVRVEMTVRPAPDGTASLYVNHWGGRDVAVVSRRGELLWRDPTAEVGVVHRPDGLMDVTVDYLSTHETVSVGTFEGAGFYPGGNRDQFIFSRLRASVRPPAARLAGERLTLVDVGAEGGLQEKWRPFIADLDVTFVEPSPDTAASLRADWPTSRVLEVGLLDRPCVRTLNITRLTGCSSVLAPDFDLLERWSVAPAFDVMRTAVVRCDRYDALHAAGSAPSPEVLKIDVQGVEHEVLLGFGDLLHQCLAVELEGQFYPIYKGQRLLHDLIAHLAGFGLMLRRLEPQMSFDGDLVEANAYFTRAVDETTDEAARRKLALVEQVWSLENSPVGAALARSAGAEPRGKTRVPQG